jgi:photosystem II stability/assembly factor-like uncharacterized protein
MPRSHSFRAVLVTLALAASALPASAQQGGRPSARPRPKPIDPFRFEMMGPASGGRIAAVAGVPGDAKTWYVGNASGGVWKSSDSGSTFRPVFDSMPVQAIGALAVSQSNPQQVWAGTGEAWAIRDADVMGDGIYLSTDSGATWKNMGLRETGRIGRIIVHPTNPKIVYACALGRVTGPQQERGVFRTTDGGVTWKRVLFVDPGTGCSGLSMDAQDPNVLLAGMWQVEMHTWGMFSGGPSSGIYISRDGGTSWTHVQDAGLPKSPLGKIDVAIAPTDSKRMYALIQTADQGSFWRSDDAGRTWKVTNWDRPLIGRAGYYIRLAVSPKNADEILVANSSFFRSMDGGKTFKIERWGGDTHDVWFDPTNADRFAITDDGGARITNDHGKTWTMVALPNGQMYHVAVDQQVPYWIYSNRQDNGTMRGPSTEPEAGPNRFRRPPPPADSSARRDSLARARGTRTGADAPARIPSVDSTAANAARVARRDSTPSDSAVNTYALEGVPPRGGSEWDHGLGGCESGFTLPDPTNPDIVWASCYANAVTRWDANTKRARSVSPWIHTLDALPNEAKYRCHWTPPLAIDPFDHETVYYGCQVVFKTNNKGQSWQVISPDLSTQDPSRIVSSGGIVADNLGQFYGEVVFAIAPSEIERGLLWAGTNDGQLWNTRDGGANWTNVTKNMRGLPTWGTIRKIEPSHLDPATAYVAVDFHMMDNRKPYIYKTTDYGRTWANVTGDLPADGPLDYVMAVTENPNRKGMLFAGTGHGFYYSRDDGAHWTQFKEGLPAAPVSWIVVPKQWHDVVVSTYGRGLFILRDIAPLEGEQVASSEAVRLYPPHPGYRQARSGHADITFSLAKASAEPVKVEILDSTGTVIRSIKARTRVGYNRIAWDLRYEPPKEVHLLTVAPDNPNIFQDSRFKGKPWRPVTHWGIREPQTIGPLAAPGHYAVRLTANGVTTTQPLEILKDKEITSSPADLLASTQTQIRIRDDMNTAVDLVNRIEVMRKQIETEEAANAGKADVLARLDALDRKMVDVEHQLVSNSDLNSDDKYYVETDKIYLNLIWLNAEVGSGGGDVAGGAEYRPTDTSLAVLDTIERDLATAKASFDKLMREDVASFNREMSGRVQTISER